MMKKAVKGGMKKKSMMKKAAMKSMMKKAAMKSMMKRRAMKVSTIARGRMAKVQVFRGSKAKTSGGLSKDKLTKNKSGKIVSKALSANSKKGKSAAWARALVQARKALGIKGFCPIGGKSKQGQTLLKKIRSIYK